MSILAEVLVRPPNIRARGVMFQVAGGNASLNPRGSNTAVRYCENYGMVLQSRWADIKDTPTLSWRY